MYKSLVLIPVLVLFFALGVAVHAQVEEGGGGGDGGGLGGGTNPPTAVLSASSYSVPSGTPVTLTWSSTRADSCTGNGFSTGGAVSGSTTITPTLTRSYSVACTNIYGTGGYSITITVTSPPPAPSPTATLSASPASVTGGQSTTLTWSSTNASFCSSNQFDTQGATSGSVTITPDVTTSYSVTCSGQSGTGSGTWQYAWSDTTDLACPWTDPNRPYSAMQNCPNSNPSGQACSSPPSHCKYNYGICSAVQTDVYSCVVSSPPPTVSAGTTVTVTPPSISANLVANPTSITSGGISMLTWSSTSATQCVGAGFSTANSTANSSGVPVSPTTTTTYLITCSNTSTGGSSGWEGGEWWTGGTQTSIYYEALQNNGQQGNICPNEAANAGYSYWNEEMRETEQVGDAGYPLIYVRCYGVSNPTGTVAKPYTQTGICDGLPGGSCAMYSYRRSGAGTYVNNTATDSAAVTVTVPPAPSGSCSASPTSIQTGQSVTWSAAPSGGSGTYTYSWSGTDSLTGTTQSVSKAYTTTGSKTASVNIGSQSCTPYQWYCDDEPYSNPSYTDFSASCVGGGGQVVDSGPGVISGCYPGEARYYSACCTTTNAVVQCNADANPGDGTVTVTTAIPTATLTASPTSVVTGSASTLTWSSTNATSCTGTGFNTGNATSGSVSTGALTATSNYQVTCTGPGGSASNTATVTVTNPTADITATPDRVTSGGSVNITWTTSQCTNVSVTKNGSAFSTATSGTNVSSGAITGQTTFRVTCDGGTASDSVVVNIVPRFEEF